MFFRHAKAWTKSLPLALAIGCSMSGMECRAGFNPFEAARKTVSNAGKQVTKTASNAGSQAQKTVGKASSQAKSTVSKTTQKIGSTASSEAKKVTSTAQSTAKKATSTVAKTGQKAAGTVSNSTQQAGRSITTGTQRISKAASGTVNQVQRVGTSHVAKLGQTATSRLDSASQNVSSQVRQVGSQMSSVHRGVTPSTMATKSVPRSLSGSSPLKSIGAAPQALSTKSVTHPANQALSQGTNAIKRLPKLGMPPQLKSLGEIGSLPGKADSLTKLKPISPPAPVAKDVSLANPVQGTTLGTTPRYPVPRISNQDVARETKTAGKVVGGVVVTLFQGFFGGGSSGNGGGRAHASGASTGSGNSTVDGNGESQEKQPNNDKGDRVIQDEEDEIAIPPTEVTGASLRGE